LLGLLWPELTQSRARHAPAQLRYAIGRYLGGDPSPPGRDLRLDPGLVVSDRESLEAAVAVGDAERVARLYRGPWLDGFFLSNAPEFERWMEEERGSLHARVVAALRRAARETAAGSDPEVVADRWGSLLAVEPMDAEGAVQRMRALVRVGDRSGAITVARAHREARARELQLPPDPAVSQLEAELLDEARRVVAPAFPTTDGGAPVAPEPVVARTDGPDGAVVSPVTRYAPRRSMAWGAGAAVGVALAAAMLAAALADADRPAPTVAPSADGAGSDPASPATVSPRSVAVMRFRSIGETPEDRYFADGMSEEIIQTLARLDGVQVSSRGSSFALSTDTLTAGDVGRRLGVETLVEGSVRRERDRLRISVRLIDAANGYTRWSETFERPATDVFAVQEAIARAIAGALRVRLAEGTPLIAPQRTTDPQTYDLYLRGRYLWGNAQAESGLRESVREFRRALARDSAFAPAWVGLADAYFKLTAFYDVAPLAAVAPARAALLRALALDSTLADVHASLGYLHTFHDRDWAAAESRFRRALALDPRNGRAHLWYAWMLAARGRHDEALREIRLGRLAEPLDPLIAVRVATMRYLAGDTEGAIEECRRVAEQTRGFALAHRQLGEALLQQPGRAEAGVAELRRAVSLSPTAETRARLAYGLARAGMVGDARRLLAELERGAARAYVSPVEHARVLVGLGEPARALDLLERAYDTGASTLVLLGVDPTFAPLRSRPRFRALLTRLDLPR
jgi:TolB-like protein/DNA-binding SARP family transcriptional activator/Flp pilus assembly protein TadD